jgi:hypothetical protein
MTATGRRSITRNKNPCQPAANRAVASSCAWYEPVTEMTKADRKLVLERIARVIEETRAWITRSKAA